MFALQPSDIAIIIIVALILFFGTSKIPELFRSMGKAVGEFKKGRLEAELEMQQMQQQTQPQVQSNTDKAAELEKQIQELQKQLEQLKNQKQQQ
ncbi:twin-arginine translocase TatA/TatE family subunit [Acidianus infernus]|uniref:Twin-arginine translocase TatA/TatE family subunit n=1 Tax=Acidianus infernus TaxID=12915 RepID=A0A6A9QHU4_ACIIN|nr:twin-arginine translocase TatA/TatE family subunit [Acidianus infernus]MUM65885.1 twin-arginine translocase TatA/TatE family subunit [Acidianus infernus]